MKLDRDKRNRIIAIVAIVVMLISTLAAGFTIGKEKGIQSERDVNILDPFELIEEVKGKDKTEAIKEIRSRIDNMKSKSIYLQVNRSDDAYQTVLVNTKGQSFMEDSENGTKAIYLGDNTSVSYTDKIQHLTDMSVMGMTETVINMLEDGKFKMYKDKGDTSELGYQVRYVDLATYNDIHDMYATIDSEFADIMIDDLKANVGEETGLTLRMVYVYGDEGQFSVGCNLIIDGEEYSNWNFDGFLEVYDWELSNEWFDGELDTDNEDKMIELLDGLMADIDTMMHKYADDNGILDSEITEGYAHSDNDIVEETVEGHYHADGTFHANEKQE